MFWVKNLQKIKFLIIKIIKILKIWIKVRIKNKIIIKKFIVIKIAKNIIIIQIAMKKLKIQKIKFYKTTKKRGILK